MSNRLSRLNVLKIASELREGTPTDTPPIPPRAVRILLCGIDVLWSFQVNPRYVAMAFDVGRETTFRREMYPPYKAQRKPHPIDLTLQVR